VLRENLIDKIISLSYKYKFKPNNRLGQNFLINEKVISTFVNGANVSGKNVLEIGPGTGFITAELLKQAKKVIAIEIDPTLIGILKERFISEIKAGKLRIIYNDVRKVNMKRMVEKEKIDKVVSAPPYYLSSEIMYRVLSLPVKEIYLILQQDFLEKINSAPFFSPSALSVITSYYAKPEFKELISASCFYPKPQVNSQVLKLTMKKKRELSEKEELQFIKLIKEIYRYSSKSTRKALYYVSRSEKDKRLQNKINEFIKSNETLLDEKVDAIGPENYILIFIDLIS